METWRGNATKGLWAFLVYSNGAMVPTFSSEHLRESFGEHYGSCLIIWRWKNLKNQAEVFCQQHVFPMRNQFTSADAFSQSPSPSRHALEAPCLPCASAGRHDQHFGSCLLCSAPRTAARSSGGEIQHHPSVLAQSGVALADCSRAITCYSLWRAGAPCLHADHKSPCCQYLLRGCAVQRWSVNVSFQPYASKFLRPLLGSSLAFIFLASHLHGESINIFCCTVPWK